VDAPYRGGRQNMGTGRHIACSYWDTGHLHACLQMLSCASALRLAGSLRTVSSSNSEGVPRVCILMPEAAGVHLVCWFNVILFHALSVSMIRHFFAWDASPSITETSAVR
jgi:hypothetical protein